MTMIPIFAIGGLFLLLIDFLGSFLGLGGIDMNCNTFGRICHGNIKHFLSRHKIHLIKIASDLNGRTLCMNHLFTMTIT